MKKLFCVLLTAALLFVGCAPKEENSAETLIELSTEQIKVNGEAISENESSAVYAAHDIAYYEDRETYDSGNPYGEGDEDERHTQAEADAHTVVHITKAGTYRVTGLLEQGQIHIDLGEDAVNDETAVVNLILDNADITCSVAPAIVFACVYECGDTDNAQAEVSTVNAGANLILAKNSVNHIIGSHIARIYADSEEKNKLLKMDGAIYAYQSMNVDGSGELYITADNEGLDTEMHLTINDGYIRITSQDDGINTNEDGVSVTTINGGDIRILAGLGQEGDSIDSNGWIVINGGTVITAANPAADSGLDSDMGTHIFGGTVLALGSAMDSAEAAAEQPVLNLRFAQNFDSFAPLVIKNESNGIVFAYDLSDDQTLNQVQRSYTAAVFSVPDIVQGNTLSMYTGGVVQGAHLDGLYESTCSYADGTALSHGGAGSMGMGNMQMPDGKPPEDMELPQGEPPQGLDRPEGEDPQMPDGEPPEEMDLPQGEPPQGLSRPEGEKSQMPDGEPPEGMDLPQNDQPTQDAEMSTVFSIDSLTCSFQHVG